ncbi:hypothetical protein AB0A74_07080 [Saccharothrix sp. NPDC042600]|uniref:hypothetical protein n=1 Tax=Saccharothrix TaxID=2071 RepID=UPI00340FC5E7|nr:hypothetical protein GCM10017745_30620 [Saccharothrix mutabilis subsp. capreolus]
MSGTELEPRTDATANIEKENQVQHLMRADTVGLTFRVSGTVYGTANLIHADKRNQHVSVTIGSVTHIVHRASTLLPVEVLWTHAGALAERLPSRVGPEVASQSELHKAAHTVYLAGEPLGLLALVPAVEELGEPEYLRVHTGPVVWQVMDRAAHASIARLWRTALTLLVQAEAHGGQR